MIRKTLKFLKIDEKIKHRIDDNVVLVSGVDLKKVRLAYPNCFMDAIKFIENVKKILGKVKI